MLRGKKLKSSSSLKNFYTFEVKKMNKRNFIALLLIFVMITIAGCGKAAPAQGPTAPATAATPAASETSAIESTQAPDETPVSEASTSETSAPGLYRITTDDDNGGTVLERVIDKKYTTETLYQFDDTIDASKAKVVSCQNDLILIKEEASFYRLDLDKGECKLINEGAVDAKFSGKKVIFFDENYKEYEIDWISEEIVEKDVISSGYFNEVPSKEDVDLPNFKELQSAILNGNYRSAMDALMFVEDDGDLYSIENGEYITNVHLPIPFRGGQTFKAESSIVTVDDDDLSIYYYGEEIFHKQLPEGTWKLLNAEVRYSYESSVFDDGEILGEELAKSIVEPKFLMYNVTNSSLWVMDSESETELTTGEIKDLFTFKDMLFFIDNQNKAYYGSWTNNYVTEFVNEGILGVSHYSNFPGFVVESGGTEYNGINILSF